MGYTGILPTNGSSGTGPKAYLNYIMFDRDFNPIVTDVSQSNFVRMTTAAKEAGTDVAHEKLYAEITVKQAGYLYILNEGPSGANGASSFVILFPSTTANDGLSYLAENQRVEIPQQSWFTFDAEQGTEKLWLVFSANAVPELEAVKQFANQKDRGLVKDAGLNARVQEFLSAHAGEKATLEKDDELKQTSLRIPGTVLVHAIKLEHH